MFLRARFLSIESILSIIFLTLLVNHNTFFIKAFNTTISPSTTKLQNSSKTLLLEQQSKNKKQNSTLPKSSSLQQQQSSLKPSAIRIDDVTTRRAAEGRVLLDKNNSKLSTTSNFTRDSPQPIGKRNFNYQNNDHHHQHQIETRNQNDDIGADGDTRVPIWNIAHMINSIEQILPALEAGSNGIEVDISFDKRGFPIESYHGFPCDCGRHCHYREDFVKFVQYVSKITEPDYDSVTRNNNLQLVLFDLKLKDLNEQQKERAGFYLATILYENLYKRYSTSMHDSSIGKGYNYDDYNIKRIFHPPIRVIISINHVSDVILIKSFQNYLKQNRLDFMGNQVGFDVGMNDNLTDISEMWDQLNGSTFNIWQGDGLTNCANIVRGVERLKEAISIRNGQGHFRKIYYWTADVMYQIRSVLRLGLDAILTNQPQRVNQVLGENEFKFKYRLATPYDNPFAQFWIAPSAWKMSPPTLGEALETVSNIKKTSANFIQTIPDGLSAIVKKVHSSITSHS